MFENMDLYIYSCKLLSCSRTHPESTKGAFFNYLSFTTSLYYDQEDILGLINKKTVSKHQQLTSSQNVGL